MLEISLNAAGGGAVFAFAIWILQAVIKNQIKADTAMEIERIKALLTRSGNIHERQIDSLNQLYRELYEAQELFKSMTRAGRLDGEKTPEEYWPIVGKALDKAFEQYINNRLIFPKSLVTLCEDFFKKAREGQSSFSFAHIQELDVASRASYWKSAASIAHTEIPPILDSIEQAARDILHRKTIDE